MYIIVWKEKDHGSCALLLDGARRVGKSYIAELFGKKEYRSYLLIDFAHLPEEVRNIFEHDIADFDMFFRKIFGLGEKEKAKASRLLTGAVEGGYIKVMDLDTAPRYKKYIPYWA